MNHSLHHPVNPTAVWEIRLHIEPDKAEQVPSKPLLGTLYASSSLTVFDMRSMV